MVQCLEHRAAAKQDAPPGCTGDRDRRGHRSRDSERAGTGDDEHGKRGEAAACPIAAEETPAERAREGDQRHARHETRHETVGRDLDGRSTDPRLPGPALDAAREGLRLPRRLQHQPAVDGNRSREDDVAGPHQPGRRLPREGRLRDVGGALDHPAVDRDLLTGAHAHALAATDVVGSGLPFARLLDHERPGLRGFDGRSESRRRSLAGARVQILSEDDEDEHHRAGVVVEMPASAQRLHCRCADRGERAQGDQRFENDVTAPCRSIGRSEHRDAEQEIDGSRQSEHEPGGGPERVASQGIERPEVQKALKHHDVAGEQSGQAELGRNQPALPESPVAPTRRKTVRHP